MKKPNTKKTLIKYVTKTGNNRSCKPDSEKAKELHTCPYAEDISGDTHTLCDCNNTETHACAWDV